MVMSNVRLRHASGWKSEHVAIAYTLVLFKNVYNEAPKKSFQCQSAGNRKTAPEAVLKKRNNVATGFQVKLVGSQAANNRATRICNSDWFFPVAP
ncbi:hypothetical protein CC2G_014789 [Coprinopsis cinerea AmutBmut pab1-1]|nr:hypothetical protein CC2G_014789 [Coprinopsis cinerea AmutBmut pab1-1]